MGKTLCANRIDNIFSPDWYKLCLYLHMANCLTEAYYDAKGLFGDFYDEKNITMSLQ